MSVFAGVTKESDAAAGTVAELSASADANDGAFYVRAPSGSGLSTYRCRAGGTAYSTATTSGSYSAPRSDVLSGLTKISEDQLELRVSGVSAVTSATDQGTGNFGNYPLYLFSRGGGSIFFNGRLYSLIVRNKLTTGTDLTNTEAWVADKTGVVI